MSLRANEKTHIVPRKRGRPTGFTEAHPEQAFKLALLGATDEEMADFWGITRQTLDNWKKTAPGFLAALMRGKLEADANVADALYKRALGYSHPAVKIFNNEGAPLVVPYTEHYPPDTNAANTWLRNRANGKWSKGDGTGATLNINLDIRAKSDEELVAALAKLQARVAARVATDVVDEAEGEDGDTE